MLRGHIVVDVLKPHSHLAGEPAGSGGDGPAAARSAGGKHAVLGDAAHIALHAPGHSSGAGTQGLTGPVGAGGGQLDALPGLQREGGEGGGAARPGDGEGGQRIHHMDLGGACQVQIPGTDGDLVRSRSVPSGVDTAIERAQLIFGGELSVGDAAGDGGGAAVHGGHIAQSQGGTGEHGQTVLLKGQALRLPVRGGVGDQQDEGGAGPERAAGGGVVHRRGAAAREQDTEGCGAAAVQVHCPLTALLEQLVSQVLLGQTGGVAGLPAVHRVEHHGAVLLHPHCGAGSLAGGIVPGGAVRHFSASDHDVAAAPRPLGVGDGAVRAGGGQGDLVPHLIAGEQLGKAGFIGGSEDIVVLADGDGVLGLKDLRDLQSKLAVDGEGGVPVILCDLETDHPAAGGVGAGGDGGEVLIIKVESAGGVAPLVEVGEGDRAVIPAVGQGEFHLWGGGQLQTAVHHGDGMVSLRAGLVYPLLDGDAVGDAAAHSEKVAIDAAHHMVSQTLCIADRLVDGGGPVNGAGGLDHDGGDVAARLQLEGETFNPAGGGVLRDGIDVRQAVGQGAGGAQPCRAGGSEGGRDEQRRGQHQGGGALGQIVQVGILHVDAPYSSGDGYVQAGPRRGRRKSENGIDLIIAGTIFDFNADSPPKNGRSGNFNKNLRNRWKV